MIPSKCVFLGVLEGSLRRTLIHVTQGGVGYVLWTEVFSTESKVTYFNKAVDRIKKDHRCLELLGDSKKIAAHGEETHNRWRRARPIS